MRLAAGILVMSFLWFGGGVAEARTTFEGRWTCAKRAVADARVELYRVPGSEPTTDQRVAQGWTDGRGRFSLDAPGAQRDDYFVRLVLEGRHGIAVRDELRGDVVNDSPAFRSGRRQLSVGVLPVGGDVVPCELLNAMRRARGEYRRTTGRPPPDDELLVLVNSPIAAPFDVPFAEYTTVRWPPGLKVSMTSVRHEFAHTVRHALDGDYAHFLADAADFRYPRRHRFCDPTDAGFAFNEGWAEYWSREYLGQSCPGVAPGDFTIEGNVALGLADLQRTCPGATRRAMVDNLRRHRGAIHSFEEFRDRIPCTRLLGARSSWCSPTGDWCVAVYLRRGQPMLSLRTFSFRVPVRVCVDPPSGEPTCRLFSPRRRKGGLYVIETAWSADFPNGGKGRYRVRWEPQIGSDTRSPWRLFERLR